MRQAPVLQAGPQDGQDQRAARTGAHQDQQPTLHRLPGTFAGLPQAGHVQDEHTADTVQRAPGAPAVDATPGVQMSDGDAAEPGGADREDRGGEDHETHEVHHLQERDVTAEDVKVGEALPRPRQGYALAHRLRSGQG